MNFFKFQYPGVATSIESDINNLMTVLKIWDLFPKGEQNIFYKFIFPVASCIIFLITVCQFYSLQGVYIDDLMRVTKKELNWEVDYEREAKCSTKFK